MTPSEVYTLVRNQVAETTPDFWGESEIYNLLWNAETVLASEVDCTEYTTTDTSVASTREYTRPTSALKISRVTWDGTKLKKINFTDVDKIEGDTEDFGDPVYYYEYGSSIGLVPTPTQAKTIKYYYLKKPVALSSSSTAFTIPAEFGHYLADYALYHMYLKDQSELAQTHIQTWQNNLALAKQQWAARRALDNYQIVRDEDQYQYSDLGII